MNHELRQEPFGADEGRAPAPNCWRVHWSVAGGRISAPRLVILSACFGTAVAIAAAAWSSALAGGLPRWNGHAGYWPASAALLALVSAAWLAGAIMVGRMLVGLRRWDREGPLFAPRWTGMLAAFSLGPLLLVLFFALARSAGGLPANPVPIVAATGVALAPIAWGWPAFVRLGEELLLALFAWLALLVIPTFWNDPVSSLFARVLLGLLDGAGLLP